MVGQHYKQAKSFLFRLGNGWAINWVVFGGWVGGNCRCGACEGGGSCVIN